MKNGKLFGKLNIIDLLIILIVLAALVFVGLRYLRPDNGVPSSAVPEKVRMTFFADEAPILLRAQGDRQLGGPVSDFDTSTYLGVLTSFAAEDSYTYMPDPVSGELVAVPSTVECFLTFACEGEGYISNDGLRINGVQYSIGGTYVIRAGQTRISCRLADFEPIG